MKLLQFVVFATEEEVFINPAEIVSVLETRDGMKDGKYLPKWVDTAVISMRNGDCFRVLDGPGGRAVVSRITN